MVETKFAVQKIKNQSDMRAKEFSDSNFNNWQTIVLSGNCPKFHKFTKIVIFKFNWNYLDQLFLPYKYHGSSMTGLLFFNFASWSR